MTSSWRHHDVIMTSHARLGRCHPTNSLTTNEAGEHILNFTFSVTYLASIKDGNQCANKSNIDLASYPFIHKSAQTRQCLLSQSTVWICFVPIFSVSVTLVYFHVELVPTAKSTEEFEWIPFCNIPLCCSQMYITMTVALMVVVPKVAVPG